VYDSGVHVKVTPVSISQDDEGGWLIVLGTLEPSAARAFGALIDVEVEIGLPFERPEPAIVLTAKRSGDG